MPAKKTVVEQPEVQPSEPTEVKEPKEAEQAPGNLYEASRKILLAAVGAAAIAQEELDGFVSRLSERGQIAEKEAGKLMKEMWDRREKLVQEKRAWFDAHRPVSASKADIESLTQKVAELTKIVEELKKEAGK